MCGYNLYDEKLENTDKPLCKRSKNGTKMLSEYELEVLRLDLREAYKAFKKFDDGNK